MTFPAEVTAVRFVSGARVFAFLLLASIVVTSFAAERLTAPRTANARGDGLIATPAIETISDEHDEAHALRLVRRLDVDPLTDPRTRLAGDTASRVSWALSPPAFDGDAPGGLTARYDSDLPAARIGFPLPRRAHEDDAFTAATAFVIASDGFDADPNGFFQISWGLWNEATTGLDRTGDLTDFSTDTFELVEFDWYPNVSPFFGGPFLVASSFGVADTDDPSFPFQGAFANGVFLFDVVAALPFDVPLLGVLEHRPGDDSLTIQVFQIVGEGRALPINGAVGTLSLAGLDPRAYELDTVGLTLWHDGFGGPDPALRATVTYHALVVEAGVSRRPESLLDLLDADHPGGDDEEDDDGGHGGGHGNDDEEDDEQDH